jgi:hypothetical protein
MSNTATLTQLDNFTKAYLECILWAETDDVGDPLDDTHTIEDFAPEAIAKAVDDCARFQAANVTELARYDSPHWTAEELGGHDLWLTRNHHGAGFWDRDDCLPKEARDRLTAAAEAVRECFVYVGDDGNIYLD